MTDNKNEVINIIITIILILLLLFVGYLSYGLTYTKDLKPTGNTENIEIEGKPDTDDEEKDETKPIFGEIPNKFDVTENNISWRYIKSLNIFSNSMYEKENKIAPESTNIYQFVLKNNNNYNIKYSIDFTEENIHKINMKYRLIKNGEYIIGNEKNWVTYEKLNVKDFFIKAKGTDTYNLEWKWFSSDNDTKIGESINAKYKLKIEIKVAASYE